MEAAGFDALPLHDAKVDAIEIDWERKRCRFHLAAFATSGSEATPHLLTFDGVAWFSMPHHEPWGPSSLVSSAWNEADGFRIEMQSGDVIEINAAGYAFTAL